jgi:hypothetical protein
MQALAGITETTAPSASDPIAEAIQQLAGSLQSIRHNPNVAKLGEEEGNDVRGLPNYQGIISNNRFSDGLLDIRNTGNAEISELVDAALTKVSVKYQGTTKIGEAQRVVAGIAAAHSK